MYLIPQTIIWFGMWVIKPMGIKYSQADEMYFIPIENIMVLAVFRNEARATMMRLG